MDINEYKDKLDSMTIKHFTLEELNQINRRRTKKKQSYLLLTLIGFAMVFLSFSIPNPLSPNDSLTISVYAADGSTINLSNEVVNYHFFATPEYIVSTPDTDDIDANISLLFNVEGKGIDTITYTCSDKEIKRNDLAHVPACFVENILLETDEIVLKEYWDSEDFLTSIGNITGMGTTLVTRLIGNSYSVKYEDQNTKQYGLRLNAIQLDEWIFSTEEVILNLEIKYIDGNIIFKNIKIAASEDIYDGFEIGLIN